ncbi:MAG: RHS repeat-associated core domain-containing protein [Desulfobacterales bacterium]|nr:RHS repeat-associated core domain-containing protein [Desulfobacterales bacterium]
MDTITTNRGNIVERMSYEAFGQRREGNWQSAGNVVPTFTNRGYTGHEHIEEMGFIHMNGRVYDPEIGRFLSADPVIQDPYNTQSYNRYSYCFNNPLSYTDPSGHESEIPYISGMSWSGRSWIARSFNCLFGSPSIPGKTISKVDLYGSQYVSQVLDGSNIAGGPTFAAANIKLGPVIKADLSAHNVSGNKIKNMNIEPFHEEKFTAVIKILSYFRIGQSYINGKPKFESFYDFGKNVKMTKPFRLELGASVPLGPTGVSGQLNIDFAKMFGYKLKFKSEYELHLERYKKFNLNKGIRGN